MAYVPSYHLVFLKNILVMLESKFAKDQCDKIVIERME